MLPDLDLKGGYLGFASWCDYNSDGYIDFVISGSDSGNPMEHVEFYKNNGDNTFSTDIIDNMPRVIYGDMAWGDMDNNGTPDLIYAGTTSGFCEQNVTGVYKNNGNGTFTSVSHEIPRLQSCHVDWVDVNNDGWQDIYFHGINADNEFDLGIFKNLGNGIFEEVETNIEKIDGPRGNFTTNQAVWADFDNDGLMDVSISMSSQLEFSFVFYKNLGDFNFQLIDIGLPQLNYVHQKAGDINQDGLIDLIFAGSTKMSVSSPDMQADAYIYINQGNLDFTEASKIDNLGIMWNTLELGDFNNDGFPDLMIYGTGSYLKVTQLYVNNHDNTFSNISHSILQIDEGGAWFADCDNDNDLDILISGRIDVMDDYEETFVYENQIAIGNQNPQPPAMVDVFAINNNVLITWPEGSDDMTPGNSLFYNLQMGTAENPNALISPFAMSEKLKAINMGNQNLNNEFYYKNLAEGSYQIKVQSIDHAYNASQFSDAFEFCFKHTQHLFPDTIYACTGDTVNLQIGGDYLGCRWNTGEQGLAIDVTQPGFYNANLIHLNLCISSETTYVFFYPTPDVNLGPDTILCQNESIILETTNPGCAYLWNNGSTSSTLLVDGNDFEPGVYEFSVQVLNTLGCVGMDTISLELVPIPIADIGADTSIYLNDSLILYAGNTGSSYLWSNGSTTDSIVIYGNENEPGDFEYWVQATNENNCLNSDTITISFLGDATVEELTNICSFTIYPNPADDLVQITLNKKYPSVLKIEIFDVTGTILKSELIPGSNYSFMLDVSEFPPGLLFVKLSAGNKKQVERLLIR
jgi:hypothetical protein